jgi:tripartite-type tricarboxylate transporter receptor subunit TctC
MMTITRFIRVCAPAWLALGMVATPVLGWAQTAWPQRPIRVLIPFPPGGPTDIVMRAAADGMQATLKQPVVIDNKPGAGGNIGASEVARAAPDGYTWLFSTDTVMTVNPHVYKSLGCVRRPNFDHPCRLNIDQGWKPSPSGSACG